MTTWFTSDLHLGHKAVIGFCNRPFQTAEEMDAILLLNYNNRVKPNDTVYWLGDCSFHKPVIGVPLLKQFLGKKILIQGNHDKYSMTQYAAAGFQLVLREATLKEQGHKLRLSHYPLAPKNIEDLDPTDVRYLERRPKLNPYEWLLHGHVHEKWRTNGRQINVGVDAWQMCPISFIEIERLVAPLRGASDELPRSL